MTCVEEVDFYCHLEKDKGPDHDVLAASGIGHRAGLNARLPLVTSAAPTLRPIRFDLGIRVHPHSVLSQGYYAAPHAMTRQSQFIIER
jgi:hypothetical protein